MARGVAGGHQASRRHEALNELAARAAKLAELQDERPDPAHLLELREDAGAELDALRERELALVARKAAEEMRERAALLVEIDPPASWLTRHEMVASIRALPDFSGVRWRHQRPERRAGRVLRRRARGRAPLAEPEASRVARARREEMDLPSGSLSMLGNQGLRLQAGEGREELLLLLLWLCARRSRGAMDQGHPVPSGASE
jgi:hypothetical protein